MWRPPPPCGQCPQDLAAAAGSGLEQSLTHLLLWQVCRAAPRRPYRCVQVEETAGWWRPSWCRTDDVCRFEWADPHWLCPYRASYSRTQTWLTHTRAHTERHRFMELKTRSSESFTIKAFNLNQFGFICSFRLDYMNIFLLQWDTNSGVVCMQTHNDPD